MSYMTEKELDDYLDEIKDQLKDYAWLLAKEKSQEMYAQIQRLLSERSEIYKRMKEIELEIKNLKEKKNADR
jgi:hypothetical protein